MNDRDENSENHTGGRPSLLIVEDDDQHRKYLQEVLACEGYDVAIAQNGVVADVALDNNDYDLMITDIIMPEKEGIELITKVHKDKPGMPILAMSGGGAQYNLEYLEYARLVGAKDILAKPFLPDVLLDKVSAMLEET